MSVCICVNKPKSGYGDMSRSVDQRVSGCKYVDMCFMLFVWWVITITLAWWRCTIAEADMKLGTCVIWTKMQVKFKDGCDTSVSSQMASIVIIINEPQSRSARLWLGVKPVDSDKLQRVFCPWRTSTSSEVSERCWRWSRPCSPAELMLLLLLNEYYLHAVKQKSCKSMLQTWNKNVSG